jgi:hypothetical protein
MSDTNTLRISTRPMRRAVVLERLHARNHKPDPSLIQGYEDGYSAEEEAELALADAPAALVKIGDPPLHTNTETIIAWLDDLCKEEQKSRAASSDAERDVSVVAACRKTISMLPKQEPGMDTSILMRIRKAEWPRDKKLEDLLGPLRLPGQAAHPEESYEDMGKVLRAWNQHVAGNCSDNLEARKVFIAALEDRINMVDKVLAIVRDGTNIDKTDKTGQEGILEPSKRRLLKAIHAYRPETQKFKSQDPFDMLAIMWANIGRANPDITGDGDWMYLTYKVLNGEVELEQRFEREEKRHQLEARKYMAISEGDKKRVYVYTRQWEVYNKNLAKAARQQTIDKLKWARSNLRDIVLDEQLQLTMLQSAQQRAGKESRPDDFIPDWAERLDTYERTDIEMDDKLERCFPDLDSTSEATAHQIQGMAMIHAIVLTRTHKFTGEDLVGMDKAAKQALLEARLNDSVTLEMMKLTKDGVLESQRVARQMLMRLGGMDKPLSELFKAVKTKLEELEVLSLFVEQGEDVRIVSDVGAEESEELLGRETKEGEVKKSAPGPCGGPRRV